MPSDVVYESISRRNLDGTIEPIALQGDLTDAVWQRVARPWKFAHEPWLYQEEGWSHLDDEGRTIHAYRVTQTPNDPVAPQPTHGQPWLDPDLMDVLEAADSEHQATIELSIRDFPDWDVPLLGRKSLMSQADWAADVQAREAAIDARADLFYVMATGVLSYLESTDAEILDYGERNGYVTVRVSSPVLETLVQREDLDAITRIDEPIRVGAGWNVGAGRNNSRIGADRFIAAGFDGDQPNPGRHAYNDITIGVIEPGTFEDEACMTADTVGCPVTGTNSRLEAIYGCDHGSANECQPVSGFSEAEETCDEHGTQVTSIALGDYEDDQHLIAGTNQVEGMPTSNPATASGMAPEAALVFFGNAPLNADCETVPSAGFQALADALGDAGDLQLDVVNASWGRAGSAACDPVANLSIEKQAENAFDDGVLVVACAGNDNFTSASCNVWAPGATPKTLSVSSFNADPDACSLSSSNYANGCVVGPPNASATGGADAIVSLLSYSGALSLVDMLGPSNVGATTHPDGTWGRGRISTSAAIGCSFAAPHVAGAAALLKDHWIARGETYINSPGRLMTMMLTMGDRHVGTSTPTSQHATGLKDLGGVGKLKLRLLSSSTGPYHYRYLTWTFAASSTTTKTFQAFGGSPLTAGEEIVKCATLQYEDVSSSDDMSNGVVKISDVQLAVTIRTTDSNGTCDTEGSYLYGLTDDDIDTRKMVAITSSQVAGGFGGRCAWLSLDPNYLRETLTTHTFCYAASANDDEEL